MLDSKADRHHDMMMAITMFGSRLPQLFIPHSWLPPPLPPGTVPALWLCIPIAYLLDTYFLFSIDGLNSAAGSETLRQAWSLVAGTRD